MLFVDSSSAFNTITCMTLKTHTAQWSWGGAGVCESASQRTCHGYQTHLHPGEEVSATKLKKANFLLTFTEEQYKASWLEEHTKWPGMCNRWLKPRRTLLVTISRVISVRWGDTWRQHPPSASAVVPSNYRAAPLLGLWVQDILIYV